VERHGISVKVVTQLTDVSSLNFIFFVPKGTTEILRVSRQYVEAKAEWLEAYNRVGRWLVDKPRKV
jgi:hypothetical protein